MIKNYTKLICVEVLKNITRVFNSFYIIINVFLAKSLILSEMNAKLIKMNNDLYRFETHNL